MPPKPMPPSARSMAAASGSRTPGRNEISILAFTLTLRGPPAGSGYAAAMPSRLLDHLRPLEVARPGLGQNSQTTRDFGIGLLHAAQVATEAVLVELLVGTRVPQ